MSKKKGICTNDECELCDKIQDADDFNFVCSRCGHNLIETGEKNGAGFWKMHGNRVVLIVVALLIIGGGGYGISVLLGGDKEQESESKPTVVMEESSEVNTTDTVAVENATEEKMTEEEVQKPTDEPKSTAPNKTSGTISLSYGKYIGDIKNGYPHGMGRLEYSQKRVINKFDEKGRMAEPGDCVQGEFVNGFFIQGRHYSSDGSLIQSIMVGVPAGNTYESK